MPHWKNNLQTNDDVQRVKRDAVIKEAGRAFSKRGYHNTSLDDVAKTLQVSKGTLYNYVKDKHEILFQCHEMALDIGDRAFEFSKEHPGSGAAVLEATLCRYIELLTEELGACGVLMEVDALRSEEREQIAKRRNVFEKSFVKIIQKGIKDGSMRSVDPKLAVFTFMGAINWMPRWFSPDGRLSGAEVAKQMTDLLLTGLVSPRTAGPLKANARTRTPGMSNGAST
jgi:AcrR family transcriptional regulator